MWNSSEATSPSVLIVESETGDVFIVENKKSQSQVEKILKTKNSPRSSRKKAELKVEACELSPNEYM